MSFWGKTLKVRTCSQIFLPLLLSKDYISSQLTAPKSRVRYHWDAWPQQKGGFVFSLGHLLPDDILQRRTYLQIIKAMYEKSTGKLILNGESWKPS